MTTPLSTVPQQAAAADPVRLLAAFRRQLVSDEALSEPVSYEEIEAYVDGLGDETSRALMAERLENDPALAAAVADLGAFAAQLEMHQPATPGQEPVRVLPFRRAEPRQAPVGRTAPRRRFGWAAVAAAAVFAVAILGPAGDSGTSPQSTVAKTPAQTLAKTPMTPAQKAEPVFVDGFEEGSPGEWSVVTSGS